MNHQLTAIYLLMAVVAVGLPQNMAHQDLVVAMEDLEDLGGLEA